MPTDQERRLVILKLPLQAELLGNKHALYSAWSKCVAAALFLEGMLEGMLAEDVAAAGKAIYGNLDGFDAQCVGPDLGGEKCLKWCARTYDACHNLRCAVDTLDSVKSVRSYLISKTDEKNKHISLLNLLKLDKSKSKFSVI